MLKNKPNRLPKRFKSSPKRSGDKLMKIGSKPVCARKKLTKQPRGLRRK